MSARAQRELDRAYALVTEWEPIHARKLLDDHGWSLNDALATLEAQRVRTHRWLDQNAMHLRARRVGTPVQRAEALASAHVRADGEVDRRQALLAAVHRAHGGADA